MQKKHLPRSLPAQHTTFGLICKENTWLCMNKQHNSHMTIGIEHVNDYLLIRFDIQLEFE